MVVRFEMGGEARGRGGAHGGLGRSRGGVPTSYSEFEKKKKWVRPVVQPTVV